MVNSTPPLVCAYCGASLPNDAYAGRRRYCSDRCQVYGWRRENPEAQSAVQRRSYGRHRGRRIAQATEYERERGRPKDALKVQARSEVNKALKRGALVKGPCEIATGCEGSVQAHHDDYAKPLDVRWLCSKHHGQHHRKEHDG